jgi:dTDP-4-amino-4,6-dideoxygalactose transaminase
MKNNLSDLAIFGGVPTFQTKLHVGAPNTGFREKFLSRVNAILDSRWLTNNGSCVRELELRLAEYLGVRHCISICNGTIGLEIAARASELHGEVIVPAMTFVASAHALEWLGLKPVFCDIDGETHNIDPESIEPLITAQTTAILAVHLWGRACPVEKLQSLAKSWNLRLLFDAAHAFACSHEGIMIGNFGDAEVFSFHATKFFNTLEGGAITTNDDTLAEKVRLMMNFGFKDYDQVVSRGTNGKMNEISAAMGLTLLDDLDRLVEINKGNYYQYLQALQGLPLKIVRYDEKEKCNFQYIVLEVDELVTGIGRDELVDILWAENVLARRYFFPGVHRMEPYASIADPGIYQLPRTEELVTKTLLLPTGSAVSRDQIEEICQVLGFVLDRAEQVSSRLSRSLVPVGG